MSKPIVLVTGCQKYHTTLLRALPRFRDPAWITVGFVGNPALNEPLYDASAGIVVLPVDDTYERLPAKIHAAFSWAHAMWPDAPGIFKTDDDIIMNTPSDLKRGILENMAEPYWGLFVGMTREGPVNPTRIQARFIDKTLRPTHQKAIYCYGHGYWVAKSAIPHIVAAKDIYESSFLEDVCTGYVLNQQKILPKRLPLPYREEPRK
jgi:hypothetical protein